MWPFLLILALVPLIFYWSDSAKELFPSVSDKLLDSSESALIVQEGEDAQQGDGYENFGVPKDQWIISNTEEGYLAWTSSKDQQYRISVGCLPDAPAALQITRTNGQTGSALKHKSILNFEYGALPLEQGLYAGSELVGSVAQFRNLYLQTPNGAVLAQFSVPAYSSGTVARDISIYCANEAQVQY